MALADGAVAAPSNEITAFPWRPRQRVLTGCMVTVDAMGCQSESAAAVLAGGAEYGLALTENQPTRDEEVVAPFARARANPFADDPASAGDTWRPVSTGHGRVATRAHGALREPAGLAYPREAPPWPGLRAVGVVEATRQGGDGQSEREARYDLVRGPFSARQCGATVRRHWGSEHQVHWLLDMALREDERRVRGGDSAENGAVLRRVAPCCAVSPVICSSANPPPRWRHSQTPPGRRERRRRAQSPGRLHLRLPCQ